MTAITATPAPVRPSTIRAQPSGFFADLLSVAGRAVRSIFREPAEMIPALMIPLFFFVVNIGALQDFSEQGIPNFDYKAFQLPVAIIFAVTGISRAATLVLDIQGGYFDRLLLTPVKRLALLLGLMVADFALVCGLCVPVMALGFALGVRFETGLLGMLAFILLAGLWGLVFTGFPYAIALKTGRFWPLFSAAFQLLAVVTHVASALDSAVSGWAYQTAGIIWSYLVITAIGYGALTAPRRYAEIEADEVNDAPGATRR